MIRHVVMWSFKQGEEKERDRFLDGLEGLKGVIPQIVALQIKKSCNPNNEYGAMLIADFYTLEDLDTYKNDPRHLAVASICKAIRTSRAAIDYEIPDEECRGSVL